MDKETLSNYGWIVIAVLVLVVMIALATPFGNFVRDAVKSTTKGLFSTSQNALNSAGVPGLTIEDQEFENSMSNKNKNVIPEGAKYIRYINAREVTEEDEYGNQFWYLVYDEIITYNEGENFPETVNSFDEYHDGDYCYAYGYTYCPDCRAPRNGGCMCGGIESDANGWSVLYCLGGTTPSAIKDTINNQPVKYARGLFQDCIIEQAPYIPDTIIDVYFIFNDTSLLENAELPCTCIGQDTGYSNVNITYRHIEGCSHN